MRNSDIQLFGLSGSLSLRSLQTKKADLTEVIKAIDDAALTAQAAENRHKKSLQLLGSF